MKMKRAVVFIGFILTILILLTWQARKEIAWAQQAPMMVGQPKPEQTEVKPKTGDSTQAQLAYVKEKNLQLQSQIIQDQVEKQLAQMKAQYADQEKLVQAFIDRMKRENGWGDDVSYDREQDKWFKATPEPKPADKAPAK